LTSISNELSLVLRVAKVEPLFKSRKLFWNFFRFIFRSQFRLAYQYFKWTFPYFAGCKDSFFIPYNPNLFSTFFQKSFWLGLFQNVVRTLPDCGCKSSTLLPISKLFQVFFWSFFAVFP
jgi:hypothetical protein